MKKPIKALLLTALVFPGIGHFVLKNRVIGSVFSALAFISIVMLFSQVLSTSQMIVEKMQSGEVSADIATISSLVHQQLSGAQGESMHTALMMFLTVWLISIIDTYRIGRAI